MVSLRALLSSGVAFLATSCCASEAPAAVGCGGSGVACGSSDSAALLQVAREPQTKQCVAKAPPKSALVVIDMQNDFINGTLPVLGAPSIIPAINSLVALEGWAFVGFTMDYHPQNHASFAASHAGKKAPFSNVKMEYTGESKLCGKEFVDTYGGSAAALCQGDDVKFALEQTLWPVHCVQDTFGQQFHRDLQVPDSAVRVRKGYTSVVDSYGAFKNNIGMVESNLAPLLRFAGAEKVYIVGLALDYCVKHTSLQSTAQGFQTFLVEDATKPVTQETGEAALQEMKANGVTSVASASLTSC